jgi:RimJ/RimL family protein N-acetyltransferase
MGTHTLQGDRPTLVTERLRLRPFRPSDGPAMQPLLNDREVVRNLGYIPYPYEPGMAEQWIATHEAEYAGGHQVIFAITRNETGTLMGSIGLTLNFDHRQAEMGYWIGRPYWGKGYGTEAARAVIAYGINTLGLVKVYARPFAYNTASQRLLEKAGMAREGILRKHFCKWGEMLDMHYYAFIRDENATS